MRVRRSRLSASPIAAGLAIFALWLAPNPTAGARSTVHLARPRSSPAVLFGGTARLKEERSHQVYVAGGNFRMGASAEDVAYAVTLCQKEPIADDCSASLFAIERPNHMAMVRAFTIDATEVTVEDYYRCVDVGRCENPHFAWGGLRFDQPRLPVTFVTWQQANDYCLFQNARLPTELEWERAARGSTHRRFPWGNTWSPGRANHGRLGLTREDGGDGFVELAPVGSYPSGGTSTGVLDLAGNVSEWVADTLSEYSARGASVPGSSAMTPTGLVRRIIRGGSFASAAPWLRSTARKGRRPDRFGADVGFRCARDVLGRVL